MKGPRGVTRATELEGAPNCRVARSLPDLSPLTEAVLKREGRFEGVEVRFRCPTPEHPDKHPSARWNENKGVWHCDSCSAGGGYVELAKLLGIQFERQWRSRPRRRSSQGSSPRRPTASRPDMARACLAKAIDGDREQEFWAEVERQRGNPLPSAFQHRGFAASDRTTLGFVSQSHGGLFPILSPAGCLVAIKRRNATARGDGRYCYVVGGAGNPAWCSPCIDVADEILIVEGELNAMAAWLAVDGHFGIMGVAGISGSLWLEPLRGRTVFVYADGDEPGQAARERWAAAAYHAGAKAVILVDPWTDGDACDIAHRLGRAALAERLL